MFEGILDPNNHFYDYFREMGGPGSLTHRYITEDGPILTCFFVSIARAAHIPVPLFEGLLTLLGAVTTNSFYEDGRTLENLGLAGLYDHDLISFFCES